MPLDASSLQVPAPSASLDAESALAVEDDVSPIADVLCALPGGPVTVLPDGLFSLPKLS